jgi:hypothetical protein
LISSLVERNIPARTRWNRDHQLALLAGDPGETAQRREWFEDLRALMQRPQPIDTAESDHTCRRIVERVHEVGRDYYPIAIHHHILLRKER